MKEVICTIISRNYISYARTLSKSYLKHHPDGTVIVLLVDEFSEGDSIEAGKEPFIMIKASELGIKDFNKFCFKYDITELNTAVKPFFLEYIYKKYKLKSVIFFDPDIMFFKPIDEMFDILEKKKGRNVLLIPHITTPIPVDGFTPNENSILIAGIFNLGFIGLGKYENVSEFIKWWQDRLYDTCISNPSKGLFVDQKWIDLLPAYRDDIEVMKNPEYNVAYWNLHERKITKKSNVFYCNNNPLSFFHFSGIEPLGGNISKHQTRYNLGGALKEIFDLYRSELMNNGYMDTYKIKCHYLYFDNGVRIPNLVHRFYYNSDSKAQFGNPYSSSASNSFYNWLCSPVRTGGKVTNFSYHIIYKSRIDLQHAFRDPIGSDEDSFYAWANQSSMTEYQFDRKFLIGK